MQGYQPEFKCSFFHFRVLSLTAPMLWRKASAEPSEGKSQGTGDLVWGGEGDGRQPKNEVKVERNECKRLHALEFGQSSGFKGQRKEL